MALDRTKKLLHRKGNNQNEIQPTAGKISASHTSGKGFVYKIYKEPSQLTSRNVNELIKIKQSIRIDISPEKIWK
jgi:hypothetical protein